MQQRLYPDLHQAEVAPRRLRKTHDFDPSRPLALLDQPMMMHQLVTRGQAGRLIHPKTPTLTQVLLRDVVPARLLPVMASRVVGIVIPNTIQAMTTSNLRAAMSIDAIGIDAPRATTTMTTDAVVAIVTMTHGPVVAVIYQRPVRWQGAVLLPGISFQDQASSLPSLRLLGQCQHPKRICGQRCFLTSPTASSSNNNSRQQLQQRC